MKVLVITSSPLSEDNGFGLTFSNIFADIPDMQYANIYCKPGNLENSFDMVGFQMTESFLIKNLKNKSKPTGRIVENRKSDAIQMSESEQNTFDKARTLRWQVLFWARELVWKIGRWKSPELKKFIDDFNPDVIFCPIYYPTYVNNITLFAKKCTNVPVVGYISDDNYTLRQFQLSPLYWIDRLFKRRKVKETVNSCEILYVISDIQKKEYEKVFKPECKILTKCADFPERKFNQTPNTGEIKIMYGGNIGIGRWKSLQLLAEAVKVLKSEGYNVRFDIYSGTPRTKAMLKALNIEGCCCLHDPIKYSEIIKLQNEADILVHAEGLSLRSRLAVHQSFSTKIVDFFEMGKCIFAIGTDDVASISHLKKNDAAVVAGSKEEAYQNLKSLLQEPQKIIEYGQKAYNCGAKFHSKEKMQGMIINDLKNVVECSNENIAD